MPADDAYAAALDLFAGSRCAGCGVAGRVWCPACAADAGPRPAVCWPAPTPPGLALPVAAAPYQGAVRSLIVAHKEHGRLAAREPLATLMAACLAALGEADLVLVPIPSRRAVRRRRGYHPTLAIVAAAARILSTEGRRVRVADVVRGRGHVADQSGLGAADRRRNLEGTMWLPDEGLRRIVRRWPPDGSARVVICDDVLTTGWTAREAQRALNAAGVPVHAVAVVAATQRRHGLSP